MTPGMRVPLGLRSLVTWVCAAALFVAAPHPLSAAVADAEWADILRKARGQRVYWNAWGGDERVNAYIQWAAREARSRFGIDVRHVKLGDTAECVARVLAEKAAGRAAGGSVDLIWINGENFASMKENGLLFGPFTERLPNFRLVDTVTKPTLTDFMQPVEGLEAPWSMAQFVFHYDSARVSDPPRSAGALLAWARKNPGRFTYPLPPDFLGTTFLKQILLELTEDRSPLDRAVTEDEFAKVSAPLWAYLDELHPHLWRGGRAFPANGPALMRHLGDGELDIIFAFGAQAAVSAIARGQLPDTVRTYAFERGTIGNVSFLAIPYNASAKEGALALINFLLSPEAQARKQDPKVLGSETVLDLDKLAPAERRLFESARGAAVPANTEVLGAAAPELHPYWMGRLEKEWAARYGAAR
jgi:putative thiamine transport system substrate-binding protein